MTNSEHFMKFVSKQENGCWIWHAAISSTGYGCYWFEGRVESAHIASYKMHVGSIPSGMELDHTCNVPRCVNPTHLNPVTHQQNIQLAFQRVPKKKSAKCKRGHDLTGENRASWGTGDYCKICNAMRTRKSYAKRVMKNE